jgi:hypothetical protein
MGVRDRIVVQVEAHVGRLADLHGEEQLTRVWILRQREQAGLFAPEGLAHGDRGFFAAGPLGSGTRALVCSLRIEIVEVRESASGKEALTYEADCPFNSALLVAPCDGHRTGLIPYAVRSHNRGDRGKWRDGRRASPSL